jgi:hypothetical protein
MITGCNGYISNVMLPSPANAKCWNRVMYKQNNSHSSWGHGSLFSRNNLNGTNFGTSTPQSVRQALYVTYVRILTYRSRGLGFNSRHYQLLWEVVLERGALSLVSRTEELLERKSSGSGLENREYGRRDSLYWPRNTIYPQQMALTSPTSSGHSVGILRSRTKATGFVCFSVNGHGSPCACETSRYPHFLDKRLREGGEFSTLRAGSLTYE